MECRNFTGFVLSDIGHLDLKIRGEALEITLFGEKLVFKTGGEGSFTLNWFYATDSCGHPGPSDFILRQNVTKIFCDRKCEKFEMDGLLKAT